MADLYTADLFAGGGGFSTGIATACKQIGKRPDLVAVNHWDIAVETHRRNHPWARHLCTGLDAVIPTEQVPRGRLDLLSASPECTHHSNARGGKPMSDQSRSSAWLILKWLQEVYVDAVLIENVQEFQNWGPLGANGRPLESMKGRLFEQFISSLKSLGYKVDWRVICAADYGGATTRERLFIMAWRGRAKRSWPDMTHSRDADIQADMFSQLAKWRAAREIIDWKLPSQSIFNRQKPLVRSTLERIAAGLRKFGGKNAEPFLVCLRNHMDGKSINEPMSTVLTDDHHALVEPFIVSYYGTQNMSAVDQPLPTCTAKSRFGLVQFGDGLYLDIHFRMLHWHELAAAMGFPPDYQFAGNREEKVRQIGNAVEVNTATALARAALAA